MPKHKMLGTQSPMKMAWSEFPVKNNISEYIKERNAEIKSSLSVTVNFLNMFLIILFPTCKALRNTPRFFKWVLVSTFYFWFSFITLCTFIFSRRNKNNYSCLLNIALETHFAIIKFSAKFNFNLFSSILLINASKDLLKVSIFSISIFFQRFH